MNSQQTSERQSTPQDLDSKSVLARSGVWSIVAAIAPLFVAILTIPPLIEVLGVVRFGVLTVIWVLIGYLNFFDLGLGRALTLFAADRLGNKNESEIPELLSSALFLMTLVGLVVGFCIWMAAPYLARFFADVPDSITEELVGAARALAFAIPFVMSTTALRGLLQAYQRFGSIAAIQIPYGMITFAAPLAVAVFIKPDLTLVVLAILAARMISWGCYFFMAMRILPRFWLSKISAKLLLSMITFGGWVTVSNIVGPLMVYFDRFFIGSILGVEEVAYYATPFDVIVRILIIPSAIVSVLFPAIVYGLSSKRDDINLLFAKTNKIITVTVFIATAFTAIYAGEFLAVWIGIDFQENSTQISIILAAGILINAFAQIVYTLVQATGRSYITGIIHLLELPIYAVVLLFTVPRFGIEGAAIVWLGRVLLDAFVLSVSASYLFPRLKSAISGYFVITCALCAAVILLGEIQLVPAKLAISVLIVLFGLLILVPDVKSLLGEKTGNTSSIKGGRE